jgi:hypothetical protein
MSGILIGHRGPNNFSSSPYYWYDYDEASKKLNPNPFWRDVDLQKAELDLLVKITDALTPILGARFPYNWKMHHDRPSELIVTYPKWWGAKKVLWIAYTINFKGSNIEAEFRKYDSLADKRYYTLFQREYCLIDFVVPDWQLHITKLTGRFIRQFDNNQQLDSEGYK